MEQSCENCCYEHDYDMCMACGAASNWKASRTALEKENKILEDSARNVLTQSAEALDVLKAGNHEEAIAILSSDIEESSPITDSTEPQTTNLKKNWEKALKDLDETEHVLDYVHKALEASVELAFSSASELFPGGVPCEDIPKRIAQLKRQAKYDIEVDADYGRETNFIQKIKVEDEETKQ